MITRDNGGRYFNFDAVRDNFNKLVAIEIGKHIVSKESMKKIEDLFNLWDRTETELRAIRNAVVKILAVERNKALKNDDYKAAWDWETKISGITAVIDNVAWKKGYEV